MATSPATAVTDTEDDSILKMGDNGGVLDVAEEKIVDDRSVFEIEILEHYGIDYLASENAQLTGAQVEAIGKHYGDFEGMCRFSDLLSFVNNDLKIEDLPGYVLVLTDDIEDVAEHWFIIRINDKQQIEWFTESFGRSWAELCAFYQVPAATFQSILPGGVVPINLLLNYQSFVTISCGYYAILTLIAAYLHNDDADIISSVFRANFENLRPFSTQNVTERDIVFRGLRNDVRCIQLCSRLLSPEMTKKFPNVIKAFKCVNAIEPDTIVDIEYRVD